MNNLLFEYGEVRVALHRADWRELKMERTSSTWAKGDKRATIAFDKVTIFGEEVFIVVASEGIEFCREMIGFSDTMIIRAVDTQPGWWAHPAPIKEGVVQNHEF